MPRTILLRTWAIIYLVTLAVIAVTLGIHLADIVHPTDLSHVRNLFGFTGAILVLISGFIFLAKCQTCNAPLVLPPWARDKDRPGIPVKQVLCLALKQQCPCLACGIDVLHQPGNPSGLRQ